MLFRGGVVGMYLRQQVLDWGLRGWGWRMRRGLLDGAERDYGLRYGVGRVGGDRRVGSGR